MSINFSNSAVLSEVGARISSAGRIVQTQHKITSGTIATTTSTTAVDLFTSNPFTMINANNKLLIEWYSDNRGDVGDNTWNLYYMDLVYVNTSTQISYTGYRGEYTQSIRHVHRIAMHSPGSIGPHTYRIRGWTYNGNSTNFGNGAGGDGITHIRITEIAQQ